MNLRERIAAEALSWLKTPYHECADLKGVGVDCAMLLVRVFDAAGLGPRGFDPRPYNPRFHLHHSDELYLKWLRSAGAVPVDSPRQGDVALFKFGRCFSHGSIIVDDALGVVHAYVKIGVTFNRQGEAPLSGRPVQYWSLCHGWG
jgi:cell wall-associated NlpC family hydrolase